MNEITRTILMYLKNYISNYDKDLNSQSFVDKRKSIMFVNNYGDENILLYI